MKIKPNARKSNILTRQIADEFLIYDLIANKAFSLNETSLLIWQLCDGTKSIGEISDAVGEQYGSHVPEELVWLALNQFKEDKLLEDNEVNNPNVYGMSRRQIIRKVGLTTAVALPLISSLIAPDAAAAQSCLPIGAPCTSDPQCCSGTCYSFGGTCF